MGNKNVDSEGCCLLCLELKQEFAEAIFINSDKCNTLNMKHLIAKYLWDMKHICPNSWLCVNCWTEIYDFHNFYMRIKQAHENMELLNNKTDDKAIDETECDMTDFKETPMKIFIDCPIEGSNENDYLTSSYGSNGPKLFLASPVKDISTEDNPLLDVEHPTLEQKRKLRKAKSNKTNTRGTCNRKSRRVAEHLLRDSANKTRRSKNVRNNKEFCKSTEDASDVENFATKQRNTMSDESKKEQFVETAVSDSINETKVQNLTSVQTKSNIKSDPSSRALHNEKDKFLAQNFKITCILCDIPFETFSNVANHFKEQHNERGYIQCCDKKFYTRNVLIDHVNYHLNPSFFKCNQCDKVLEDRRRLELHSKTHEVNNGKNFCCKTCGKGFITLAMLNVHTKIHLSEEEKLFRCHECRKNFASKYMLRNHNRQTHLKLYHKICEICGKSIQDKTIFERHMLQHEGKTAPAASCDVCGLLLTDEKALERHKKVIHPENGQKVYTCSICNKISPNLRNHKLHVRFTHESGYNYKCTICAKAFKRPQPLKEHMASHTGEILYTCPWCPKTFNSNANMHHHRKKVHPKEWEENSRKRYSGKLPPRFKPPTTIEHSDTTTSESIKNSVL